MATETELLPQPQYLGKLITSRVVPGVVNRTKSNQKSIEPKRSDCGSIGSVIEHNGTGTFR